MTSQDSKYTRLSLPAVEDILGRIGYDIETEQPGEPPHSTVVARRDLGDRAVVVTIDAGGRFRINVTSVAEEWSQLLSIAGVPVRAVETARRSLNLTGQISSQDEASRLVAELSDLDLSLDRSDAAGKSLNPDPKPQQ
jgi:hypothetical protein